MADNLDNISYRPFVSDDLPLLTEWLKGHGKGHCDPELLSTTGLVVSCNDIPVCLGFLYQTNSALALIEQITADPASDKKARGICVDALIYFLCEWAKALGNKTVIAAPVKRKLLSRGIKQGFVPIATNATVIARSL